MHTDDSGPNVDQNQLQRENAHGDAARLPDGAPGLGSSDGDVPPDAIRGPLGGSVTTDDEDDDEADEDDDEAGEEDDDIEVADLP